MGQSELQRQALDRWLPGCDVNAYEGDRITIDTWGDDLDQLLRDLTAFDQWRQMDRA